MNLLGKSTIPPFFFFTGKILGNLLWLNAFLLYLGVPILTRHFKPIGHSALVLMLAVSLFFVLVSLYNLGRSTRFGLPVEDTEFKTQGLYKLSRNPMYLGINLITISAMGYGANVWVLLIGFYSLATYHFIIKSEEAFLENRFGEAYLKYKKKVRRYL